MTFMKKIPMLTIFPSNGVPWGWRSPLAGRTPKTFVDRRSDAAYHEGCPAGLGIP